MVHGIKRRSSLFNTERIDHLYKDPHEKNVKFKLCLIENAIVDEEANREKLLADLQSQRQVVESQAQALTDEINEKELAERRLRIKRSKQIKGAASFKILTFHHFFPKCRDSSNPHIFSTLHTCVFCRKSYIKF